MHRKLILFTLAGLLLSIKADGRFPIPATVSETVFQLILLPYTFLFVVVILLFFKDRPRMVSIQSISFTRLASAICLFFGLMILILHVWQERKYSSFGYALNVPIAIGFALASSGWFVRIFWKQKSAMELLAATGFAFVGTYVVSILSYPLHPGRSDMLPLIQAAGQEFLAGGYPYIEYSLPHAIPLTYPPGMWLSYLPAVFLGFDLRLIHLVTVLLSVALVYAAVPARHRESVSPFCALFLMIPYLHYRHEIYIGIFWATLSAIFYFHMKGRPFLMAIFVGLSAAVSQFTWVLIPVILLSIGKQYDLRTAVYSALISAGVASAVILPFAVPSLDAFYQGTIRRWAGNLNVTTFNFSYFIAKLLSIRSLLYLQIFLLVVIYFTAMRDRRLPDRSYEYMTNALMVFLLFNSLIWVYFYLAVFLLMIFHVAFQKERKQVALS